MERYANHPDSPGYNKSISFENLLDIQPLLFCTEEIALFTLTLNCEQIISATSYIALEVLLFCCENKWAREDETLVVRDGYFVTNTSTYASNTDVHTDLGSGQQNGNFTVKLSDENLRVGYNMMKKRYHDGKAIIVLDSNTQTLKISKDFVEKRYERNETLGRYTCKYNPHNLMQTVFVDAYCTEHTRRQNSMIIGTSISEKTPCLLNGYTQRNRLSDGKMAVGRRCLSSLFPMLPGWYHRPKHKRNDNSLRHPIV